MRQVTINTPYPNKEKDLYNELHRIAALTYKPVAQVSREAQRLGLKLMSEKDKLYPVAR
tara:strand:- start:509 stop:685 length:177 start_codon:yes stop_codon:yes gene_type:complete